MQDRFLQDKPTYLSLPDPLWLRQDPITVTQPDNVHWNQALAEETGIPRLPDAIWAGSEVLPGSTPFSQAYAGHQFGHFTVLGDGRAVVLGEHLTPDGERIDVQLKGSGRTPYSRGGDGRAVLGPMLREMLISEAMYALGIPTTRSLAVTLTGETVMRETPKPGAVLVRTAASHLRVGTFEFAAQLEDPAVLKSLLDYAIQRHYPDCSEAEIPAAAFLSECCRQQSELIASWMGVGFVHGVMNTDNMAISGETIDYGPCAFLDEADPAAVFSSIDQQGRYAFAQQPGIAHWNLAVLASALLPLFDKDTGKAEKIGLEVLDTFPGLFQKAWRRTMALKLGIPGPTENDDPLISDFLETLQQEKMDYTEAFLSLESTLPTQLENWGKAWLDRIGGPDGLPTAINRMQQVNPVVIPRNYQVEEALTQAENGEQTLFRQLWEEVTRPFDRKRDRQGIGSPPPPGTPRVVTFCGT